MSSSTSIGTRGGARRQAIPIRAGVVRVGIGGRGGDRRRHERVEAARPCKVFREATCRYTSARTRDVSAGGVMLELEATRPVVVGEKLGVGIAWTGSAVLSEASMVHGVVVRVEDLGEERQGVAVRFGKAGEGFGDDGVMGAAA